MKHEPTQLPFFQTCRRRYSAGSIGPLQACRQWSSRLTSVHSFLCHNHLRQLRGNSFCSLQLFGFLCNAIKQLFTGYGTWKAGPLLNQIEGGSQLNRSKWPKNALFSMYPYHQGFDSCYRWRAHSLKIFLKKHSNTNILNKRLVFRLYK